MSTQTLQELGRIAERVFVQRETTLEQEATDFNIADLKETVLLSRRELRNAAVNLPDAAYEPQPGGAEGKQVWSAGEILSHIAGTMIWTDKNLREILGMEAAKPAPELVNYSDIRPRSKDDSLVALGISDRTLVRILDMIPADADTGRTIEHERFGTIGVKGWLLLTALHEADHARQLRGLAGKNGS